MKCQAIHTDSWGSLLRLCFPAGSCPRVTFQAHPPFSCSANYLTRRVVLTACIQTCPYAAVREEKDLQTLIFCAHGSVVLFSTFMQIEHSELTKRCRHEESVLELWQLCCFYSNSRKINHCVAGSLPAAQGTLVRGSMSVYKTIHSVCLVAVMWNPPTPRLLWFNFCWKIPCSCLHPFNQIIQMHWIGFGICPRRVKTNC